MKKSITNYNKTILVFVLTLSLTFILFYNKNIFKAFFKLYIKFTQSWNKLLKYFFILYFRIYIQKNLI